LTDRVAQLGGKLSVGNQRDRGVLLTAEIPLAVPA
jgi:signal transduction histidine kinase